MTLAARAAEQLYGRPDQKGQAARSDREILQRTNASVNKVNQFLAIEHMFTPRHSTVMEVDIGSPGRLSHRARPAQCPPR